MFEETSTYLVTNNMVRCYHTCTLPSRRIGVNWERRSPKQREPIRTSGTAPPPPPPPLALETIPTADRRAPPRATPRRAAPRRPSFTRRPGTPPRLEVTNALSVRCRAEATSSEYTNRYRYIKI
ncbi:Protein of unknown function [Gryllus bimaculatus]|nr:Protein of unknown function [Gryllus bimaculatus]